MASGFPNSLDSFVTHADGTGEVIHAAHINALGDAIGSVQTVLGLNPEGEEATVAARLAALEAAGGTDGDIIDGGDPFTTFVPGDEIDGGGP